MIDVASLQQENADLKALLDDKNSYIQSLEDAIRQAQRKQFGASSEKVSADQINLFNEAEADTEAESTDSSTNTDSIEVKGHTRQSKPRVTIPVEYPREDIIYDLAESDKTCPHDGTPLNLMGSENHEQLDIIPAQIKVLRHKRLKYSCPCCKRSWYGFRFNYRPKKFRSRCYCYQSSNG